jgi:hypothetical protein
VRRDTGFRGCGRRNQPSFRSRRTLTVNRGTVFAEESPIFVCFNRRGIPHFVRNDGIEEFFRSLCKLCVWPDVALSPALAAISANAPLRAEGPLECICSTA